ncbi:MAG: hypothetical protein A3F84_02915 [Candidatus Handelsmanbacteria bacterium RIFCSPLOWO2_12_FULL_64_10]|uniref:Flippase-like domain-containing protein n=1 Tax=Handelsmanbacteria sp. (strain RIFCSPLOWO2_12_FULL_64_10) TaxID=1817868 RepID=A0A1F6CCI9_HANXR|nr:MAG: hypothetical protein A3F84_02915 [Candidatus Handelsmanbacteria bacterium RIFCSPLOWO2_12_FULL_64_10]
MKRILLVLLKAGVSIGLMAIFFVEIDWPDVMAAVEAADVRLLWGAAGLFLASNLLGAVQWDLLLRAQGIVLPHLHVQGLYVVGVFFNNFLISNIGGDAVRVYDLRRVTGEGSPAFAATFVDRFVGLFTMTTFSLVAYLASPGTWGFGLLIPIVGLCAVLAGVLAVGFSRRISGLLEHVGRRLLPLPLGDRIGKVRGSFILYRSRMGTLAVVLCLSVLVQVLRVAVYYSVSEAMRLGVSFRHFLVFIPMIAVVAAVPISFGGIGVRENFGALLFQRVGVGLAPSLALMFLGYLAGIVASLVGGVVFVVRRVKKEGA